MRQLSPQSVPISSDFRLITAMTARKSDCLVCSLFLRGSDIKLGAWFAEVFTQEKLLTYQDSCGSGNWLELNSLVVRYCVRCQFDYEQLHRFIPQQFLPKTY